jgi:thiamine-phosphate pyrophosphorylase
MRLLLLSPPAADARERAVLESLFSSGLERYHVRKPGWPEAQLEAWLLGLPEEWRPRLVLHEHHRLAARHGLGGRHEKDPGDGSGPRPGASSRACHDLPTLRRLLDHRLEVLFGPVFPSLSKPGHGPAADFPWTELAGLLGVTRSPNRRAARVFALGGVTAERLPRCRELGFDGAAVLGAVWGAPDPVAAWSALRTAAARLDGARHAA